IKGMKYSELECVNFIPDLVIEQFGRDCFIYNEPTEEDIKCAREGLNKLREILKQGEYDLVVLEDRKSTRLNSSHVSISYAVFCLKKKKEKKKNNKLKNK